MKEFLEFAKEKFVAAKWYGKIYTIFFVLGCITTLIMSVYFILFGPSITIRVIFFSLWTAMMVVIGELIEMTID